MKTARKSFFGSITNWAGLLLIGLGLFRIYKTQDFDAGALHIMEGFGFLGIRRAISNV